MGVIKAILVFLCVFPGTHGICEDTVVNCQDLTAAAFISSDAACSNSGYQKISLQTCLTYNTAADCGPSEAELNALLAGVTPYIETLYSRYCNYTTTPVPLAPCMVLAMESQTCLNLVIGTPAPPQNDSGDLAPSQEVIAQDLHAELQRDLYNISVMCSVVTFDVIEPYMTCVSQYLSVCTNMSLLSMTSLGSGPFSYALVWAVRSHDSGEASLASHLCDQGCPYEASDLDRCLDDHGIGNLTSSDFSINSTALSEKHLELHVNETDCSVLTALASCLEEISDHCPLLMEVLDIWWAHFSDLEEHVIACMDESEADPETPDVVSHSHTNTAGLPLSGSIWTLNIVSVLMTSLWKCLSFPFSVDAP